MNQRHKFMSRRHTVITDAVIPVSFYGYGRGSFYAVLLYLVRIFVEIVFFEAYFIA
jgi:hypothetical protein